MRDNSLSRILLHILFGFVVVLIIINVFRHVNGFTGSTFGFDNLLSNLSNSNSMQIRFDISAFQIGGDWGIVDGIRRFFNAFATILGVLIWLGTNLINLVLFVAQFARLLFV